MQLDEKNIQGQALLFDVLQFFLLTTPIVNRTPSRSPLFWSNTVLTIAQHSPMPNDERQPRTFSLRPDAFVSPFFVGARRTTLYPEAI
jgi:hypothetical protein